MNQPQQSQVQQFVGQNVDTALENNDWSPAQFPSMLSGYTCPQQDLDMSSHNPFESGLNYESFQPEVFHYPDPQYLQPNNFYSQTSSTADMSHWGPAEPTTPQLQCSSLGYTSRDGSLGSWSSADYSFQSNTDAFFQFYPNSYQENQCFLSPSTPGPSPHYPPSFVTSPSNDSTADRLGLFVDPAMFTVTPETKGVQSDVIQEQPKQKKATRVRAPRPRKSRAKSKDNVSPVQPVSVEPPPLSRRQVEKEEGLLEAVVQGEGGQHHLSLMRDRDRSHYRPPPILRPKRAGPGLLCSLHKTSGAVSMDTASLGTLTSETTAPCINIGRSFQAEIPPIRHRRHVHSDSHNALLLWKPSKELEQSANQQRVEALLKLAQSSAVPKGGANPEDVLLLLSENRGDFLLTLEKLLNKSPNKKQTHGRQTHLLSDYI